MFYILRLHIAAELCERLLGYLHLFARWASHVLPFFKCGFPQPSKCFGRLQICTCCAYSQAIAILNGACFYVTYKSHQTPMFIYIHIIERCLKSRLELSRHEMK